MESGERFCVVLCTAPGEDVARRLGRGLVEQRLAACVNVVPLLASIYRWQGAVHEDAEVLMLIKAPARLLDELERVLASEHPYDVPEIVALPMGAVHGPYLAWIRESTDPADRS